MADALFVNPYEMEGLNPFLFYPNGMLESRTSPIDELTSLPEGSLLPGASDEALTAIPNPDDTPYDVMPTPGMNMTGYMPAMAYQNAGAIDTSEPRSLSGLQATETWYAAPNAGNRILDFFSGSPVAALFLGLGALLFFNSIVLHNRGVGRGASRTGRATARVGESAAAGATGTAGAGIEAVNSAVGGAVEAVEGVTG